jgi:predicted DsbA family dithiol-disulfide isomerase
MAGNEQVRIDVWSDYVCPFCYLDEPTLDRIQEEFGSQVTIEHHAYELRPYPVPTLDPKGDYLHNSWTKVVYPMARMRGMTLRLPPIQPRSRRAAEAAEFARSKGLFREMHLALFRAFFEDGLDLNDIDILVDVGAKVGLDRQELRAALETGQFTERVLADEALAHRLGINVMPTMLIGRADEPLEKAVKVTGAQNYPALRDFIAQMLNGVTVS